MADTKKTKTLESHPKIEIPDPHLQIKQFEYFIAERIQSIEKSFSYHNNVIIAIFLIGFVIILLTVAGLIFQSWQFVTTYQRESIQLKTQEELITNTVKQQEQLIESHKAIEKGLKEIEDSLNK